MSFIYPTIILVNQTGEIDIDLAPAASLFQITLISKTEEVVEDLTTVPPIVGQPAIDIILGNWKFDAKPYLHSSLPSDFEPVYTTPAGTTLMSIEASLAPRTFHLAYFSLNTLKVKPSVEITEPYSIVIKQGVI